MKANDPGEIYELPSVPNVLYVVDVFGEGWYCTGVDEHEPLTGECTHEDSVEYNRSFGG